MKRRRDAFFARRRSGVRRFSGRNEDEAQAMSLVIARAGEAIQPWLKSWIGSVATAPRNDRAIRRLASARCELAKRHADARNAGNSQLTNPLKASFIPAKAGIQGRV
jgi:hypothetical protein